ncbi:FtsX-like permease family protein [Pseudoflavonifractor capillosus]|uniref:ABC transporter permease n=1 Tax=Pseudoflavonifractor capillosus TaxID=106588 RepID=UPI001956B9F1|nr:ABC transporter permease [Pseudoflavonifractor capillosus]MBM6694397.1 FtsX-like permease family protein [Pseudoflavonifractor capillosus]
MVKRKNRLLTDFIREVRHTYSRFLSILLLSALAVAFLVGLRATAPDMEYTADNYYDSHHLMDGYILSTMGLTQEDLQALAQADGVDQVEGAWSVDATAVDSIVSMRSMPENLNLLNVVEGRLPQQADECVTEQMLLTALGLEIGDTLTVTLDEADQDSLTRTSYTIVGTVQSPLYVGTDRGSTTLGSGSIDAFVYIPGENFDLDVYTTAYFTGDGMEALNSYSQAYADQLSALVDSLDPLAQERASLRDEEVRSEAQKKLDDARSELADAQKELDDAKKKLDDARAELDSGWEDYESGLATLEQEIKDGQAKLNAARSQLEESQTRYEQGKVDYQEGLAQYQEGQTAYEDNLAQLDAQQEEVAKGYEEYYDALKPFEGTPMYDQMVEQLAPQKAKLDEAAAQIQAGYTQLAQVKTQLEESKAELDAAQAQLQDAAQQLDTGWAEYQSGQQTLDQEEARGRSQLAQAKAELDDGEAEYQKGLEEYEQAKADAQPELEQAQADIDQGQKDLDAMATCEWYVLGRDTNSGFVSYSQDAERVDNLSSIFPVIFFVVAALACLTTMTRMVEEQRTQIGSLKALGFSRLAISQKYIGYAFVASLVGGLIGLGIGATLIPAVIANAFQIMYAIPGLDYKMQLPLFVLAVLAAVACTTGAALWACLSTLIDTPANLMRPRAPKAGKRVFLEYIKPIWRRLSFTWKVTMRNLFRYQKRFWMTVIGIGGCTALIVTGFGLHESIFDVLDKQFDEISLYDATVGLDEDLTEEQKQGIEDYLDGEEAVVDYMFTYQQMMDASTTGTSYDVYLFAVDDVEEFGRFVDLRHRSDHSPVELDGSGVVIDEKLSELLGVSVGDTITLEGDQRVEAVVADITENYVYHYVYLTRDLYTQLYGEDYQNNVMLLAYQDGMGVDVSNQTSETLMKMDGVASYSYIATIRDSFEDSMDAINYAVVIIIVAAAALAFVVLYNLTNINITERRSELATLKVLGFYDGETTAYVLRENVFLTIFGVILGLVLGRFLHSWMVLTVEVDLVMFGRTAPPYAYVLAAALTALFSLIVNVAAHFRLKKIDMVESLKTVE